MYLLFISHLADPTKLIKKVLKLWTDKLLLKIRKILVVGGAGFVGVNLVPSNYLIMDPPR